MAWRPNSYLVEGVLDNTKPNKITGWMKFAGLAKRVKFDLTGNFHRDIRGARIKLTGHPEKEGSRRYMRDFSCIQIGSAGDITAGLPPADYTTYPYIEWYSEDNGRVVIELDNEDVELLTSPIPAIESDPISRKEQNENLYGFLRNIANSFNKK